MKLLFKFLEKILLIVNRIKMPWTKKILSSEQIRAVLKYAKPLDLILVTAGGEATNILFRLLPGKFMFTHSAMCIDPEMITDCTAKGVDDGDMLHALNGHYRVAVIRAKLGGEELGKVWDKYLEISKLDKADNIEYNYNLVEQEIRQDGAPESTTCSQYMRVLYNAGRKDFIGLKKIFKFNTVTPNNLYDLSKFDLVYDSKQDKD